MLALRIIFLYLIGFGIIIGLIGYTDNIYFTIVSVSLMIFAIFKIKEIARLVKRIDVPSD